MWFQWYSARGLLQCCGDITKGFHAHMHNSRSKWSQDQKHKGSRPYQTPTLSTIRNLRLQRDQIPPSVKWLGQNLVSTARICDPSALHPYINSSGCCCWFNAVGNAFFAQCWPLNTYQSCFQYHILSEHRRWSCASLHMRSVWTWQWLAAWIMGWQICRNYVTQSCWQDCITITHHNRKEINWGKKIKWMDILRVKRSLSQY